MCSSDLEMLGARLFAADTEALARPLPQTLAAPTPEPGASTQSRHVRDRTAVIHRNVFDSDAGCLDCADAAADGGDDAAVAANPLDDRIVPPEACMRPGRDAGVPGVAPGPCDTQAKITGAVVGGETSPPASGAPASSAEGVTDASGVAVGSTPASVSVVRGTQAPRAQAWPARDIRLVLPSGAGGGSGAVREARRRARAVRDLAEGAPEVRGAA